MRFQARRDGDALRVWKRALSYLANFFLLIFEEGAGCYLLFGLGGYGRWEGVEREGGAIPRVLEA